jgi:hypothetical protein
VKTPLYVVIKECLVSAEKAVFSLIIYSNDNIKITETKLITDKDMPLDALVNSIRSEAYSALGSIREDKADAVRFLINNNVRISL